MLRQERLQEFAQRVAVGAGLPRRDEIGDETPVSGVVVADDDDGVRNIGMLRQRGLDLAQLDANAADLDLTIVATEKSSAVGAAEREVACPVHPRARLGDMRIGNERGGGELGTPPVAAPDAGAADVQLPVDPDRHRLVVAIEDIDPRVVDRRADRDASLVGPSRARPRRRHERRFRRSVRIDEQGAGPRGELGGHAWLEHFARGDHEAQCRALREARMPGERRDHRRHDPKDARAMALYRLDHVVGRAMRVGLEQRNARSGRERDHDLPDRLIEADRRACSTQSPSPGAKRRCIAAMWLTSARCSIITPFGAPVEPDV